jgi:hypothetical protein
MLEERGWRPFRLDETGQMPVRKPRKSAERPFGESRSLWDQVKREPKRSTVPQLKDFLDHLRWLQAPNAMGWRSSDTRAWRQRRATRTSIPNDFALWSETSGCTRSFPFPMSQVRQKAERVGRSPPRRSCNYSTGKSFTVDGLREKLREFFRQEVRAELRAVAALNNVELITALISCIWQLALVGLQLRMLNGVVSLLTTEVETRRWPHI